MSAPPPRLDERIPEKGFATTDEMLDAFLAWVADIGLSLYPHQQDAILEVFGGNHVVLDAPTGSGKSLVAVAMHFKTFAETGRAWYTAPIKALVSQKFFELCELFGAENVGMMTGDGSVNRDAPILCCTAEILANLALREQEDAHVSSVVMDEFHYYADRDRGMAWQIPLLTLPQATFVLMSGTLGDTSAIRADLEERTGKPVSEILGVHRPVPLEFIYSMQPIHDALRNLVTGGKAPVYVVHFTQRAAAEQAQALMSTDYCTKEEKAAIAAAVKGFGFHSPFGPTLRRYVLHGVGLHHAGLLPRYRLLVERLAQQGLLKIISGTDTLGVGINVPIRTVVFTQLCKFDGEKVVILPVREFKQIAGRAGRAGYDTVGYVVAQAPAHVIENAKIMAYDPKRRKKAVKAQPPTRGYKPWDENTFQQLIERPPEPLESRFTLAHGQLLSLMQHAEEQHGDAGVGLQTMKTLIERAHLSEKRRAELQIQAEAMVDQLASVGVVSRQGDASTPSQPSERSPPDRSADPPGHHEGRESGFAHRSGGASTPNQHERLALDPTLQRDFSLHHSLSLFLLDALAQLDAASPTHALDVVTWVEAILEHPRAVLMRQVDRAKGELIAELKAAGVEYDQRMEALEEVSWPKPNGEVIYAFFNAYAEKHPWVAGEAIRPKSIVREMVETYASFAQFVNDLGLQRSEGVLLRYLSEAYKALIQNVPPEHHTEQLLDVIAYLRTMLAHVDESLLTEWERLVAGGEVAAAAPPPIDISADRRRFVARVRAELHALVRALSTQVWEEAAAGIRQSVDDPPWSPEAIAQAAAPVLEEYGEIAFDTRSRQGEYTTVTAVGPHQWVVRQRLVPKAQVQTERYAVEGWSDEAADEGAWAIEGRIDLRADTNPEGPIIELVGISE
jgi:superfamily II RNA helicase